MIRQKSILIMIPLMFSACTAEPIAITYETKAEEQDTSAETSGIKFALESEELTDDIQTIDLH